MLKKSLFNALCKTTLSVEITNKENCIYFSPIDCKRSSTFECEQFFEALFSQDDDDFFDAEMQELQKNIFFVSDKKCKEKKKSYTMKPQDEQPAAEFKSRKKMRSHTNI